jgi:predicted RNA-binding Zn-ribbon protein involved in translation (DUF1610 family)
MSSQTISSTGCDGSRGVSDKSVKEAFASLLVSAPDEGIRSVLLKIKSCDSHEANSRAVISAKVHELRATLVFLRGIEGDVSTSVEISDLLQAGLAHCIVLEVANLLPYQCSSCANPVNNLRLEKPSVTCRGCGVGACSMCFSKAELGWTFMCPPCGFTFDKTRKIPDHLMKSRSRKKSSASQSSAAQLVKSRENVPTDTVEEVTIEDVEDTDEDTNEYTIELSEAIGDSQDSIPLGQGSPPLTSTQAGASAISLSVFPNLSLDLTSLDKTAEAVVGVGAESTEAAGVSVSDFIEPPKRVKAGLKKLNKANKSQAESSSTSEDPDLASCRFFLKGNCKYGFFGKGKAGQGKCPYKHPKSCRKLMDNGNGLGGCSKGKACEFAHPKMCHQSMTNRSCPNIKDGARCLSGYHVRGTKFTIAKPLGVNNSTRGKPIPEEKSHKGSKGGERRDSTLSPVPSTPSFASVTSAKPLNNGTSLGDQQAAMSSVFSEIVRAEVVKLLRTGTLWPQNINQSCGPVVPPATLRGPDTTTPMGNLGALLSLLGVQQQHLQ